MKLDQEHQHSMSQNVDQRSEDITDSRKDNKVKLKMAMHIVHKKSGVGVCVCVREREREDKPGDQQQHLEVRFY